MSISNFGAFIVDMMRIFPFVFSSVMALSMGIEACSRPSKQENQEVSVSKASRDQQKATAPEQKSKKSETLEGQAYLPQNAKVRYSQKQAAFVLSGNLPNSCYELVGVEIEKIVERAYRLRPKVKINREGMCLMMIKPVESKLKTEDPDAGHYSFVIVGADDDKELKQELSLSPEQVQR